MRNYDISSQLCSQEARRRSSTPFGVINLFAGCDLEAFLFIFPRQHHN